MLVMPSSKRHGAFSTCISTKNAVKAAAAPAEPGQPGPARREARQTETNKRGREGDEHQLADRSHAPEEPATRSSGRHRREPDHFRPLKKTKASAGKKPAITSQTLTKPTTATSEQAEANDVTVPVPSNNGGLPLSAIMANLHGGGTGSIVGREEERRAIARFLDTTVGMKQAGALYVSGRPGCGKTLSVCAAAAAWRRRCKVVTVNGMSLIEGSRDLFSELLKTLCPAALKEKMDSELCLRKLFTADGGSRPTLLVVDELDALLESGCEQSVLATLFSWTQLPGSKLVLIGIANALDLTHRFLPVLRAKNCAPQLLTFMPYNEHSLLSILRERLDPSLALPSHAPAPPPAAEGADVSAPPSPSSQDSAQTVPGADPHIKFDKAALDLCARRVAAESGDTRKVIIIIMSIIIFMLPSLGCGASQLRAATRARWSSCCQEW